MSDLVEKLRHLSPFEETQDIATEAAERIEKLEAENKELRGDLNIATLRLKAALGQKRGDFDINDPGH